MKTKLLLSVLFISFSLISTAKPTLNQQLAICAKETINSKRLACYDLLQRQNPTLKDSPTLNTDKIEDIRIGNWTSDFSPSVITDDYNLQLQLKSANTVKSRTQTVTPVLSLICKEGKSTISINWGVYLGKNRTTMVTRIGQLAADNKDWRIKEKYTVISQSDNEEFINQLKNNESLAAQISPFNAEPIITTFKLAGLREQLEKYKLSCKW